MGFGIILLISALIEATVFIFSKGSNGSTYKITGPLNMADITIVSNDTRIPGDRFIAYYMDTYETYEAKVRQRITRTCIVNKCTCTEYTVRKLQFVVNDTREYDIYDQHDIETFREYANMFKVTYSDIKTLVFIDIPSECPNSS